ncbi:MAG: DUF6088 family protein [Candidatus Cloacimonetes bacterium]|nr:DUF6088 family protein [Candidatus Cloacimonadota bacterium]
MKISEKIEKIIDEIKPGSTFTYQQLSLNKDEYVAGTKAIERFIKKGIIKRVSTGIFYIPKKSVFGELKPREEELIKPYLLNRKGKRIAYITGTSLYNKMGLTTQIPRIIKIASRDKRIYISNENIKATAIKSYVDVTDQNYYLLQVLDALKDFKKIPNLNIQSALVILINIISRLSKEEINKLIKYVISYPPRVIAFLGALLEKIDASINLNLLRENLNPLSNYKIGIDNKILSTAEKWSLK